MKRHILLWLLILIFLPILLADMAAARDGGVSDQDLNQSIAVDQQDNAGPDCGGQCHTNDPGGTISISKSPAGPYIPGQTNININVTTKVAWYSNINDTMGIMLVNYSNPGGNIKNDGWIITNDEKNNIDPYNYNQKAGIDLTINQTYSWEITAPDSDNIYYIVAEARYGSTKSESPFYNYSIISPLLSLIVDGTPPSVTSNTNNLYVKTGTVLTLNATITDALADVNNATVNVSAVNSTINEAFLTLTGPYWLNTTIIADKNNTNGSEEPYDNGL